RLRPLPAQRFPESTQVQVRVSNYSTVRVKKCAYSVPARRIGSYVQVEVCEAEIVVRHDGAEVLRCPRSVGQQARIDYRHVVESRARKPGAAAGYIEREEMVPRAAFRQAYDRLQRADPVHVDRRYVRLLALAARHGEDEVAVHVHGIGALQLVVR